MNLRTLAVLSLLVASPSLAADHADGPRAVSTPATDITDLYTWMSDANHLALVMNVFPDANGASTFSSTAKYVFHLNSSATFAGTKDPTVDVICTFTNGSPQTIKCWVGTAAYVEGDASSTTGLMNADGKVKVFAGLRNDPFFFNLSGLNDVRTSIINAAPMLLFDSAGCPSIDALTSSVLVSQLNGSGMAVDAFLGKKVLSLVVVLDKSLVSTMAHPVVSVWASTHQ